MLSYTKVSATHLSNQLSGRHRRKNKVSTLLKGYEEVAHPLSSERSTLRKAASLSKREMIILSAVKENKNQSEIIPF